MEKEQFRKEVKDLLAAAVKRINKNVDILITKVLRVTGAMFLKWTL